MSQEEVVEPEPALHTRTRTKPEVKWLANELAAVKGELERIDEALSRLHARKSKLLAVQVALSDVAGQLTIPELPAVVPAVRAHERYGARGNLSPNTGGSTKVLLDLSPFAVFAFVFRLKKCSADKTGLNTNLNRVTLSSSYFKLLNNVSASRQVACAAKPLRTLSVEPRFAPRCRRRSMRAYRRSSR